MPTHHEPTLAEVDEDEMAAASADATATATLSAAAAEEHSSSSTHFARGADENGGDFTAQQQMAYPISGLLQHEHRNGVLQYPNEVRKDISTSEDKGLSNR